MALRTAVVTFLLFLLAGLFPALIFQRLASRAELLSLADHSEAAHRRLSRSAAP
jgi:hypothetical protein